VSLQVPGRIKFLHTDTERAYFGLLVGRLNKQINSMSIVEFILPWSIIHHGLARKYIDLRFIIIKGRKQVVVNSEAKDPT
jgi:hypothetical protein